MLKGRKKFILLSLALVVFGLTVVNVRSAFAIPVEDLILEGIATKKQIEVSTGAAALGAVIDGAQYFLNKLAYDAAVWLSSGQYNLKDLHITGVANYLRDVGLDSAGEMVGSFGKEAAFFKKYGINLCTPPDLNIQLSIKLDLLDEFGREPKPRCKFKDIANAYANIASPGYWRKTGLTFGSDSNELAVRNKLLNAVATEAGERQSARDRERDKLTLEGKTIPPLSAITNQATKSIVDVEDISALDSLKKQADDLKLDTVDAGDLLAEGFVVAGLKKTAKTFFGTLIPRLVRLGIEKGSEAILKELAGRQGAATDYEGQPVYGGREAAQLAFAELVRPEITSGRPYDYVKDLAEECNLETPSVFCGTLDAEGLGKALSQAQTAGGPALTVAEAIKSGLLNPNGRLIDDTPQHETKANEKRDCADNRNYCLTNLKKLRSLRILPIGWEAAAEISGRQSRRATLGEVVAGFNNRDSLYYHLIDPDWVLKAPLARCNAFVYGETLASKDGSIRRQTCVDIQTCLTSDANGRCVDEQYGYCRREKNVWRLAADKCDAQYNTCATLTSRAGATVSYLTNTVDQSVCDLSKVGCRAYSSRQTFASQNLGGQVSGWTWDVADNAPIIHFTKAAESCSATDEGCTKFIRLAGNEEAHLKKAPAYYNCYGETVAEAGQFSSTTLSYWPANKTDLVKLATAQSAAQKTACQKFAPVCTAEEVGCQEYTPKNGNPAIPGVISAEDSCDQQCVGYSTYKQIASFFEPVLPTASDVYFIPNPVPPGKITQCSAAYVGCDEFVNIGPAPTPSVLGVGGGESKEYYQELRYCSDQESDGAAYFTWEGDDTAGYQLKSHILKYSGSAIAPGPPAYRALLPTDDAAARTACNQTNYQTLDWRVEHPDCREFYDKDGNISYRLFNQTISVSATECVSRRKTVSAGETAVARQDNCEDTGGTWQSEGQFCIYKFIRSQSLSCPAQMNGCRAYKGTTGNNLRPFFGTETFENQATGYLAGRGFVDGGLSTESTVVSGHSLTNRRAGAPVSWQFDTPASRTQLIMSFWAKGTALTNLTVKLFKGPQSPPSNTATALAVTLPAVNLSNDWHVYEVGPLEIDWPASGPNSYASSTIRFESAGQFFIDNMNVRQITDNVYVVKNSWTVPARCDNPVPQAQLGCAAYSARGGEVYLKSFTNLCRKEAVGCEAMTDTFNRGQESAEESGLVKEWNKVCRLVRNQKVVRNNSNVSIRCQYDSTDAAKFCSIAPNEIGCYFNRTIASGASLVDVGAVSGEEILILPTLAPSQPLTVDQALRQTTANIINDQSTVIVPAPRRVYLVNDDRFACQSEAVGCSALGLQSFEATNNLTSPLRTTAATVYLKNQPDKYGQTLCAQKFEGCEEYTGSKGKLYFKDPTIFGKAFCEWKTGVTVAGGGEQKFSGWFKKGASSPCYDNFVQGTTYGIWRNGDREYQQAQQKMVGLCPAEQNTCSEFVDVDDFSEGPTGKSYYFLDNSKLTALRGSSECNGQVSKTKGCILFNETSQRGLIWHAISTYTKSLNSNSDLVAPVNCEVASGQQRPSDCRSPQGTATLNNANLILKVARDRVCGEWLACRTSTEEPDQREGRVKSFCSELVGCQEAGSNSGDCAKYAPKSVAERGLPLTEAEYKRRGGGGSGGQISWSDQDYSGFSILGQRPVEAALDTANPPPLTERFNRCRVYPEENSPYQFPKETENNRGFWTTIKTNKCAPGEQCDCSYRLSTFGEPSQSFYFSEKTPTNQKLCDENSQEKIGQPCNASKDCNPGQCAPSIGVCDGGTDPTKTTRPPRKESALDQALLAGSLCSNDAVCGANKSKCLPLNSTESKIAKGGRGFCLEQDESIPLPYSLAGEAPHPCFNWLPIDKDSFNPDVNNQYTQAGGDFFAALEEINYCAAADVFKIARARGLCASTQGKSFVLSDKDYEYGPIYRSVLDTAGCGRNYWTIIGAPYGFHTKDIGQVHDNRQHKDICRGAPYKDDSSNPHVPVSCISKGAKNLAYNFSSLNKAQEDDQNLIDNDLVGLTERNFYDCDRILQKLHALQINNGKNYSQLIIGNFRIPTWDTFFEITKTEDAWYNPFTINCAVTGLDKSLTGVDFKVPIPAIIDKNLNVLEEIASLLSFSPTSYSVSEQVALKLDLELACREVTTVNKPGLTDRIKSFTDRVWKDNQSLYPRINLPAAPAYAPGYAINYNINPEGGAHVTYNTPPVPFGRLTDFDSTRRLPWLNQWLAQPLTYCAPPYYPFIHTTPERNVLSCYYPAPFNKNPSAVVNANTGISYGGGYLGHKYTYGTGGYSTVLFSPSLNTEVSVCYNLVGLPLPPHGQPNDVLTPDRIPPYNIVGNGQLVGRAPATTYEWESMTGGTQTNEVTPTKTSAEAEEQAKLWYTFCPFKAVQSSVGPACESGPCQIRCGDLADPKVQKRCEEVMSSRQIGPSGLEKINEVFAKIYVKHTLPPLSAGGYQEVDENYFRTADGQRQGGVKAIDQSYRGVPPTILPVLPGQTGAAREDTSSHSYTYGGFTISSPVGTSLPTWGNPARGSDILSTNDNKLSVTLEFFAFAAKNQLPIRRVLVDWDDGSIEQPSLSGTISLDNAFLNRRAICDPAAEEQRAPLLGDFQANRTGERDRGIDGNKQGFGGRRNSTCLETPFRFIHTYFCRGTSDPKWLSPIGACVFRPRVQVVDNWEWCNKGTTLLQNTIGADGLADSLQTHFKEGGRWIANLAKIEAEQGGAPQCGWTNSNQTVQIYLRSGVAPSPPPSPPAEGEGLYQRGTPI